MAKALELQLPEETVSKLLHAADGLCVSPEQFSLTGPSVRNIFGSIDIGTIRNRLSNSSESTRCKTQPLFCFP